MSTRAEDLEREATRHEVPSAAECAALAAAWEASDPASAARWAVRAVDGGADFTAWRAAARVLDRVAPGTAPDQVEERRVMIVGTSTTTALLPVLRLALAREGIAATLGEPPYGQYWQAVLDERSSLWSFRPDTVVLVPDHHALDLGGVVVDPEQWVETELQRFTAPWERLRGHGIDVVQVSFAEPPDDALGSLAAGVPGSGRARLRSLNRRLAEVAGAVGLGFVDAEAVAAGIGKDRWFAPRYWHAARHAVALTAVPDLGRVVAAAIAARSGLSRRCLVLDLDNTLWGGVIGDDGLDGVVLGGTAGEAYLDFQRALADLGTRGIVLAVCSKNDPQTAREPFEKHPDMVLTLEDIAAFDASWDPKPDGIRRIAAALGLGLRSMLFVDDNPAEREIVRRQLPEVDVLVLPDDPADWRRALLSHPRLEPGGFTDEDRQRTGHYRARARAAELQQSAGSLEEFHASLAMTAVLGPLTEMDVERAAQLVAKTNQFNLTHRRQSLDQIRSLVDDAEWWTLVVRLRDRFADHGLVAVVLAADGPEGFEVDTFVMSCRVIGRGLERVIMGTLVDEAQRRGRAVRARYRPTDRNGLVADLWGELGMSEVARTEAGERMYALDDPALAQRAAPIEVVEADA